MKDENAVEGFYQECAKLLRAEHTYKAFPYGKRTRWNNRAEGNGRFVGHGLIRMFSDNLIVVTLMSPRLSGQYSSTDAALAAIRLAMEP